MRHLLLALFATAALGPAALAQPAGSLTLRDRLVVVSAGSAAPVAQALAKGFADRYEGAAPPILHSLGGARALEAFCAGTGPQTPDAALVTRRMPRAIAEGCQRNGVRDIIELELGLGAVVLAVKRGEPAPGLTSQQVWMALAAERAEADEFLPNRVRAWSDIAPGLPRGDIRVLMPDRDSGIRMLFDDLVMEAGCRHVPPIRLVFEASYRREKCVTTRADGRIARIASGDLAAALLASPPGTIGVIGYDQLLLSGGNLVPLPLDGVLPTAASIASLDYEPTRTIILCAKRQHSRSTQGVGVVRGVREFLIEAVSEPAAGPGGYLTTAGLVPLGPAERAAQRRIAERQTPMSR